MGWTWDYCEETLTMDRYKALLEYWKENPPIQAMVAAYLGIGKKETKPVNELINMLQSNQIPTQKF